MDGSAAYKPNRHTRDLPHLVGTTEDPHGMKKGDIPGYMTFYFWSWFDVWWWWHEKGNLPLERSWFHHPKHVTETIQMFESVYNNYQAYKAEINATKLK